MFLGRLVLDEMCKGYSQSERRGHDTIDIENACSTLIYNPSRGNVYCLLLCKPLNFLAITDFSYLIFFILCI